MPPRLTVVVPAFNEAARLGRGLRKILDYLNRHERNAELIVVDDGSDDETKSVAEASLADSGGVDVRVIRYEQNRGNGLAVRSGLLAVLAEIAFLSVAA